MTYDKKSVISWRAIDAIGRLCASMPADEARAIIQRVLWMMREESGGNPWSAPEIIGEIITRNREPFADIIPVLCSFRDETIFTPGVMRAMSRIAGARADLVAPFSDMIARYAGHPEPSVRGYAIAALGSLGKMEYTGLIEEKTRDEAVFDFYDGSDLRQKTVASAADEALSLLKKNRNNQALQQQRPM